MSILLFLHADEKTDTFFTREKLTFKLKWGFIVAGRTTLELHPNEMINDIQSYHFVMTTRTTKFLDTFYKVRDQIDAYAHIDMNYSLFFKKKQREGRYKRDIVVTFDWDKNEAQYSNHGEAREPIKILPGTFDPLSAFYALRMQDLKENLEIELSITDGKKCKKGTVKILERQIIEVEDVKYDTYRLQPDTKDIGGVFKKSKDAKITIWVTADKPHVPVRLQSKVLIGHFTADLISIE
ncbi:MAG: DUF3108 domain-containing protein [bacterium]